MPRRDDLTYDVGPGPRRSLPWRSVLLLVAVVVVGLVLVVWVAASGRSSAGEPVSSQGTVSPVAQETSSPPTVSTSASSDAAVSGAGSDDGEDAAGAPAGSVRAARRFVDAWLERDARSRKAALAETAVPALAEQLELTAADNIPDAEPAGAPVLEDASSYSVQFTQTLSSGMKIRIYLVADPQAPLGWSATSVERVL